MNRLKQKHQTSLGFTLIELLVVISIMAIFATIILVNYNQLRAERSRKIARNELASNIRKTQSYALSGRITNSGISARFYLVKLTANATGYTIQSINSQAATGTAPVTEETINLPQNTPLQELYISRPGLADAKINCAEIVFAPPFGKVYIDASCAFENAINNPAGLLTEQDAKLHIMFNAQAGAPPQPFTELQMNGVVGSVLETTYTPN